MARNGRRDLGGGLGGSREGAVLTVSPVVEIDKRREPGNVDGRDGIGLGGLFVSVFSGACLACLFSHSIILFCGFMRVPPARGW